MESNMPSSGGVTETLRASCHQLAAIITGMHPLANKLEEGPVRAEILKALFEITKQVEVVKKQLQRAERRDDSRLL